MSKPKVFSCIFFMLLSSSAYADDLTFKWEAVTLNVDGTPCTDLGGYKLYRGTAKGTYGPPIDVGNLTTYTHTESKDGKFYFVVSAYDTSGNESAYSNEVTVTIDHAAPKPPTGFSLFKKMLTALSKLFSNWV